MLIFLLLNHSKEGQQSCKYNKNNKCKISFYVYEYFTLINPEGVAKPLGLIKTYMCIP